MLWNEPETPISWVKEAPLKLVAVTLADRGNSGKPADLRFKLEGQVLREVKWDTWWKRVQPSVRDSAHFQVVGVSTAPSTNRRQA